MAEAWWRAECRDWARPVCEQAPYNILDRRVENERVAFLQEYGWGLLQVSPLAGGVLAGHYPLNALDGPPEGTRLANMQLLRERTTPRALEVAQELSGVARELGISLVGFAIAWLMQQPGVTAPIIGPADQKQYQEYIGSARSDYLPKRWSRSTPWCPRARRWPISTTTPAGMWDQFGSGIFKHE